MDTMLPIYIVLGVVVVVVIAVAVWLFSARAALVRRNQSVDEAWQGIASELSRRAELIPALVATVREHASHERRVFEEVAAARERSIGAASPGEAASAEPEVKKAVRAVFVVAQGYPKLQASREYLDLQQQFSDTDDSVQAARRKFNSSVRDFNTRVRSFPSSMFARGLGLSEREFFEIDDPNAVAEPPRVQF
ncbi:MAG TPA: LemA family protein [Candidatus Agrococcus pullicola]|uniref:LemA family protein n=1 Tax=Candidatus Agrococcus pullicola TaxID=2838429 RepID=A0A9D2C938_9MICO|nr:LemA family protein [Candidatus Agrococcus pullicola]